MRLLPLSLVLAASFLACGNAADPSAVSAPLASKSQSIIKGTASTDAQNATVLLFNINQFGGCTGTLIAPNLILTARHCVSRTDGGSLCNEKGRAIQGGVIGANLKPSDLWVFTGTKAPSPSGGIPTPAAVGAKIIDDGSKTICNSDLALLITDKPVKDAPIAQIRLDGPPKLDEEHTAVGWGLTESGQTPSVRMQRGGIKVLNVGPAVLRRIQGIAIGIADAEFEVGESICSGDSGGPLFAPSGAVVGVVSRGGNGRQPSEQNPQAACIGDDTRNYYTHPAGRKDLIMRAFQEAQAEPWLEGQPDPRLKKAGEECTTNEACRSNECLDGKVCAPQDCKADGCPEGYTCADGTERAQCTKPESPKEKEEPSPEPTPDEPKSEEETKPQQPSQPGAQLTASSGCRTAPGAAGNSSLATTIGLGLALVALGRRRKV
jgi:hypothetical protein